ncbi:MAG: hypothetical protein WC364_12890 [Eubacteriales bacterium]
MTNAQATNILSCQNFRCKFLHRCLIHWGGKCSRQGGKKVPRMRTPSYNPVFEIKGYSGISLRYFL